MKGLSIILAAATVAALAVAGTLPAAAQFSIHTNHDIPGPNIDTFLVPTPANGAVQAEVDFCQRSCELNNSCLAFTLLLRGDGTPSATCRIKSPPMSRPLDLLVVNRATISGIRLVTNTPCWAREVFELGFCNVVSGIPSCPPGSIRVDAYPFLTQDHPGAMQNFAFACVSRMASDPGGLPNCTDAFGASRNAGDAGSVNRACLDAG